MSLPTNSYGLELILLCIEKPILLVGLDLFVVLLLNVYFGYGILGTIFFLIPLSIILLVGVPLLGLIWFSFVDEKKFQTKNWEDYIDDPKGVLNEYKGQKIPIQTVQELYINSTINLKKDFLQVWLNRNNIFKFSFTLDHFKFFWNTLIKDALNHNQKMDKRDVGDVYNRGNDFYNWFLGDMMIYTSGIFQNEDKETLEEGQTRKLDLICQYTQMKPNQRHLDIGCGWGTFVSHAAKNYGTRSTGVTLANEQVIWGKETAKKYGVSDKVEFLCMDYRDIPKTEKYDIITCLEMSEHVGIKNYAQFLAQIKTLLKEDGVFYLQIAGLRRVWHFEDLVWGLFMDRYIFPGADASCPLYWVTNQLERQGFEVHRVENCGVHYAVTILKWYENWIKNEKKVVEKYGVRWFRLWQIFLGWSTIIARQGSSTVFLITTHLNHRNDARSISEDHPFNRSQRWIGPNVVATQQ